MLPGALRVCWGWAVQNSWLPQGPTGSCVWLVRQNLVNVHQAKVARESRLYRRMPLRHTTAESITAGDMEMQCHHLPCCCDNLLMPALHQAAGTEDLMLQDGRANHTCAFSNVCVI